MHGLREFFETNYQIVVFGYGLVFFLAGFALYLQGRQPSNLRMARHLRWLAAFGFIHGVAVWGMVFIPFQRTYLSQEIVLVLRALQVGLLALSHLSLFVFGANLLVDTLGRYRWLRAVPYGVFLAWLGVVVYGGAFGNAGPAWLLVSDVVSRYLLASVGAAVTAWALALQRADFEALGHPPFGRRLGWMVASFVVYGFLGGVIVPYAGFFPANAVNEYWVFSLTGIPVEILRGANGFAIAFFLVRMLEIFSLEYRRRIEEARSLRAVVSDRDRIARELHDGIIQRLYAVGLQLENASYLTGEDPEAGREEILGSMQQLNTAIQDIRRYIMDLRSDDEGSGLKGRLLQMAEDLSQAYEQPIELRLEPLGEWETGRLADPGLGQHVVQILREALSNALRHARAGSIQLRAVDRGGELLLEVVDDGVGFDVGRRALEPRAGQGLRNMKERARLIGGRVVLHSRQGHGTRVQLFIPKEGDGYGRDSGSYRRRPRSGSNRPPVASTPGG